MLSTASGLRHRSLANKSRATSGEAFSRDQCDSVSVVPRARAAGNVIFPRQWRKHASAATTLEILPRT